MSYWQQKELHKLHWGHWQRRTDASDWRIVSDNFEPCYNIANTTGEQMCVKFGNEWASKPGDPFYDVDFQHPRDYAHDNWYFWDNPELPQLLWRNPANPTGSKDWIRWVKGSLFTTHSHTTSGSKRINGLLKEFSKGVVTNWLDIASVNTLHANNSKLVLIVPSSEPNYPNYYGTTQQEWLRDVIQEVLDQGLDYEIRFKPGRKARANNAQLTDQLKQKQYLCTVSQHSVAAVESIMAGTPAVVTGPHPAGDLATTWEEFVDRELRRPHTDDVVEWIDRILGNCRHKREIFTGEWHATTQV